jgi:nitrous oxide reductase accessory protein NosL
MKPLLQTFLFLFCVSLLFMGGAPNHTHGQQADHISPDIRCSVCGMFVAKYPNWLVRIHYNGPQEVQYFDGVKDMMVFYFNPERYGGAPRQEIKNILVRDYYSLDWLSAKEAFFVVGSDIYGPMGHELIPFSSMDAAENFIKDHRGKKILTFDKITSELIESLRVGQRMR